jgi:alkanesulfonate monooxygenase SsuD/methylene tetrahydromethanopterin reductase-like flavin-dependent oxidoreductase (luciferase family)
MAQIQLGLVIPNGPYRRLSREEFTATVEKSLEIAAGHFDSVWLTDHLQFEDNPLFEGWTALTYQAALHPQFKFGHAVLAQSFRNPALLAKMSATLQYLTNGRFILGIGAGWKEDEYTAYGYDFPTAGRRLGELEESLQIINALWREKQATVEGKYYRVVNAYCEPKPEPLPPIVIGGTKPRILRLIARYADWWNVSGVSIDNYKLFVQESERACEDVGRDPKTLRRTWFGRCLCAPTEEAVQALNVDHLTADRAFVGTPEQVIAQMRAFVDLGVDYFMFGNGGFPHLTTLEMLINEVLPAFES